MAVEGRLQVAASAKAHMAKARPPGRDRDRLEIEVNGGWRLERHPRHDDEPPALGRGLRLAPTTMMGQPKMSRGAPPSLSNGVELYQNFNLKGDVAREAPQNE
jgi:hypothetical protein